MAAYEEKGYLTSIDKNGNKTVLFPATKIECIDGLEEALASAAQTGSGIYVNTEEPADAPDGTLWLDLDENSESISANVESSSYISNAYKSVPKSMISFTDDDCRAGVITKLLPVIINRETNKLDTPYTFAVPTEQIGKSGYLTVTQLQDLQEMGATFSCHTKTESIMTDFDPDGLDKMLTECEESFRQWGISDVLAYAYCNGVYSDENMGTVKKHFRMGFTVENGINEIPYESYYMKRVGLFANTAASITINPPLKSGEDRVTGQIYLVDDTYLLASGKIAGGEGKYVGVRFTNEPIAVSEGEEYILTCSAVWGGSCYSFRDASGGLLENAEELIYNYVDSTGGEAGTLLKDWRVKVPRGAAQLIASCNLSAYPNETLSVRKVSDKCTLATAKKWVDKVYNSGGWLTFMTHAWYQWFDPDDLADLITYIRSMGIPIVDVNEGIRTTGNVIEIGSLKKPAGRQYEPFFIVDALGEVHTNTWNKYTKGAYKLTEISALYYTGTYLKPSGGKSSHSDANSIVSSDIAVSPGEVYWLSCSSAVGGLPFCVYNSPIGDSSSLSVSLTYDPDGDGTPNVPSVGYGEVLTDYEIVIPEGSTFMRISCNLDIQPDGFKIYLAEHMGGEPDDSSGVIPEAGGAYGETIALTDDVGRKIAPTGTLLVQEGSTDHIISQAIPVSAGERYKLTCSANFGNSLYAIYSGENSAGTLLKNRIAPPTEEGNEIIDQEVLIPVGAKTMRVAWNKLVTNTPYAVIKNPWGQSRPLLGQIVVVIGDSIVERNKRTSINFIDHLAINTGAEIVNMGVGGTGYMAGQDEEQAFYQRAEAIPDGIDRVLIYGSGNDRNMPLGEPADTGTETLCGCVNATLDVVFERAPTAWVGVIAPAPWKEYPPFEEGNAMEQIAGALAAICRRRGVPYLDLYHCSGLRPWDEIFRTLAYSKDDGDGTHPDETGHAMIAPQIQAFLLGSIQI